MFFVISEFGNVLKENLESFNKNNILLQRPNFTKTPTLPLIAIYYSGFKFEESGLGAGIEDKREERKEEFSGDGKQKTFKLQEIPVNPILSVESPKGSIKLDPDDYKVDYSKWTLTLRAPIPKGKNNMIVTYATTKIGGEAKGLKLRIRCCIELWAKNEIECDSWTLESMKAILLSTERFMAKGISIIPVRGTNITEENSYNALSNNTNNPISKGMLKDAVGRKIIYLAETTIKAEIKVPRIEKIDITEGRI